MNSRFEKYLLTKRIRASHCIYSGVRYAHTQSMKALQIEMQ